MKIKDFVSTPIFYTTHFGSVPNRSRNRAQRWIEIRTWAKFRELFSNPSSVCVNPRKNLKFLFLKRRAWYSQFIDWLTRLLMDHQIGDKINRIDEILNSITQKANTIDAPLPLDHYWPINGNKSFLRMRAVAVVLKIWAQRTLSGKQAIPPANYSNYSHTTRSPCSPIIIICRNLRFNTQTLREWIRWQKSNRID